MRTQTTNRNLLKSTMLGLCLTASVALTGCSADFGANSGIVTPISGGSTPGATIGGNVHGGQQPVNGSTVQLWIVGTSGYGSVAAPLGASVKTNPDGGFMLGSYTCPGSSYAYITAAGGDPQIGTGSTTNPGIALMAALGPCSSLTSATFININEVTTVAAVWAMAPFGKVTQGTALSSTTTTPSDTFGTSATNVQGIANAMGVAANLASVATGMSPGTNTNLSNVEYWQVNTLADILAQCINTTSLAGANCAPVVTATTPSSGTAPADTLQIALYLAQNPTMGTSLLSQVSSTAPFQPYDTSVNDWTIGYSINTGTSDSRWIAFDAYGNAWVASGGSKAYEYSPTGTLIDAPTTYTVTGAGSATTIGTAYQVAVDTANNAWFIDSSANSAIFEVTGSTAAGIGNTGTASSPMGNGATGTAVSATSIATSGLDSIAIDGTNNVWAAISGKNLVGVLSGSTALTTGGPVTGNPYMIAIDQSNQSGATNYAVTGGHSLIYTLDSSGCGSTITYNGGSTKGTGGSIATNFSGATTIGTMSYTAGAQTPALYLVDSACVGASTNTGIANSSTTIANGSNATTTSHNFMSTPYGIAIDGGNNIWAVNNNYTAIAADGSNGAYSLSKLAAPNYGTSFVYTTPTPSFTSIFGGGLSAPFYLSMDGAGAAWVGNSTTPTGGNPTATGGLSAFSNTGTALSPSLGFYGGVYTVTNGTTTTYSRLYKAPRGVAVDGSGNIWEANTGATYMTVVVGAATPTVTPLSLGIKNGTLSSRP